MSELASAEIVIVGGGAVGVSVAYHLAKMGKRDVLLLEKAQLTHGCTWHAAGLVGQLRGTQGLTRMMQYSAELYGRLEAETGQATDWKPVGSLRVASSPERWQEIRRTATSARSFGFELHLLSPREAQDLFPLMDLEGVVGAAFIPSDGYVDPFSLTQSLAKGARNGGVSIREGITVTGFEIEGRRVCAVLTDQGAVPCETVVNCAGLWARQVGAMAGVAAPAAAVEHQYLVTDKSQDLSTDLPTFRDPDKNFYLKPEVGGLAIGGWEDDTIPFCEEGIPFDFGRELLASNFDRFEQIMLPAAERLPVLNELGVKTLINGPIPVSPDGEPVMGLAPELDNYFLACGFTAGIAGCGGAGRAMAEWIVEGSPGLDLWAFDVRRFGPHHLSKRFLHDRAVESYGRYYKIHWPGEESQVGRGLRRSPFYEPLKAKGAVYGSKFGWERPNYFDPEQKTGHAGPTFGRPDWFEAVGEEHKAVRERVALIDQSSFSKFELSGPGACAALNRLSAARIDRPVGRVIYAQLCNEAGGIECDVTICRLAEERFLIVTGSSFGVHDRDWIERHLPREGGLTLRDVTADRAVINLCGPKAREVLQRVTGADVSNEAFAFSTCREIAIGAAPALALRLGYVGELGWEIHLPPDYAAYVYDRLWQAGQDFGIANVGYRAIESLRLEKGYLYWSSDISPQSNPYEAGLGGRVNLAKGDFIGRTALARIKEEGPARRMTIFTVDEPVSLYGGEALLHNGQALGATTSGGYGYSLGKAVIYAYLPADLTEEEGFEVEAFGECYAATRQAGPLYDPAMQRLKS